MLVQALYEACIYQQIASLWFMAGDSYNRLSPPNCDQYQSTDMATQSAIDFVSKI